MNRKTLLILAMMSAGAFQTANAGLDLTFSPDAQNTTVGGNVAVDVVLNGLTNGEILSAFDLSVTFKSSVVGFTGGSLDYANFGPTPLPGGWGNFSDAPSLSGSTISFDLTSPSSDAVLQGIQGGSVTLGTLDFTGLGVGISPLTYSYVDLTGANVASYDTDPTNPGLSTLANGSVTNGSITIPGIGPNLPEPATLWLIALGAFGLVASNQRKVTLGGVC